MLRNNVGELTEARLRELAIISAGRARDFSQQEQVVLTVATLVEGYVDAILYALIAASGYDDTAFGRAMFAELEDRIFQSWPERHSWLSRGFGVSVSTGTPVGQNLATLNQLRNALAHGGGRLTERQSRNVGELIGLEKRLRDLLAVEVDNRFLHLSRETGDRAIGIVREYILDLDRQVREQHPAVRF